MNDRTPSYLNRARYQPEPENDGDEFAIACLRAAAILVGVLCVWWFVS